MYLFPCACGTTACILFQYFSDLAARGGVLNEAIIPCFILLLTIIIIEITRIWPIKIGNNTQNNPIVECRHYSHFPPLCLCWVVVHKDGCNVCH